MSGTCETKKPRGRASKSTARSLGGEETMKRARETTDGSLGGEETRGKRRWVSGRRRNQRIENPSSSSKIRETEFALRGSGSIQGWKFGRSSKLGLGPQ
ncbi:unnamed protein product [Cuscuta epithymum]|uniref:Uncharacterized protein n=1 Tax=Cuscuta epithymum TaxID=186058 RepID=A0AAV0BXX0_9ASTE|nr:unnamed protein product [Cuscuta epithymum]